jgi:hypothetical protein
MSVIIVFTADHYIQNQLTLEVLSILSHEKTGARKIHHSLSKSTRRKP